MNPTKKLSRVLRQILGLPVQNAAVPTFQSPNGEPPEAGSFGVLGIMKNEEMNVIEWLDHYFWQGASKIYLIDNGSTDRSIEIARSHPRIDDVILVERPKKHSQVMHYREVVQTLRVWEQVEWLVVADLDEFWFCKDGRELPEYLAAEKKNDLIYSNWTVFGSNGLEKHPDSLRLSITACHDRLDRHVNTKWILRSKLLTKAALDIHKVYGVCSGRVISDNTELQLNHYMIQSREFFEKVKMTRGSSASASADNVRDWDYFNSVDHGCVAENVLLRDRLIEMKA